MLLLPVIFIALLPLSVSGIGPSNAFVAPVQLERTRAFEQVDFALAVKKTASTSGNSGAVFVQDVPEQARKEYERGAALLEKN